MSKLPRYEQSEDLQKTLSETLVLNFTIASDNEDVLDEAIDLAKEHGMRPFNSNTDKDLGDIAPAENGEECAFSVRLVRENQQHPTALQVFRFKDNFSTATERRTVLTEAGFSDPNGRQIAVKICEPFTKPALAA